ncbi:MAG: helix-turn-helix transcriptional regulator [Acidimicrobiaceae bacterium]|nr:helix-turn-helix transcriptional regulator [Chromatiales bacterium]MYC52195.1 helix-turn-helix transcriptional regulator [Gammaproteobacteria bacterium]MYI36703.1 helix-turn-helix transcriptional regulator [Acidimicrobiaceae bacterium]
MSTFWDSFPERHANMYSVSNGLVYTAKYATPFETERVPALLLISLEDSELIVNCQGSETRSKAVFVGNRVKGSIEVWGIPFAAVHIGPSHPAFRALADVTREIPVREMDFSAFSNLLGTLRACYERLADQTEAQAALDSAATTLIELLGVKASRDPRIGAVIEHLTAQSPLDYRFDELLEKVMLSPGRFSHLFTEEVGISLRSYQKWRKIREALRLLQRDDNLTAVAHLSGFSDSAHFSRTFSQTFGLIPTLFRSGRCVQVIGDTLH